MKKIIAVFVSLVLAATAVADVDIEAAIAKGAEFLLANQHEDGYWSDKQMPALTALPVWALSQMKNEECRMKNEECRMKNVECRMKNEECDGGNAASDGENLSNHSTFYILHSSLDKGVAFVLSTQREDGGFYVPKPGRGGSGLGNYNTSVCLSALYVSGKAPTAALLKAREYIASSQLTGDDTMAGGFGYDKLSRRRYADLSNTSYALDAMKRTAALEELRPGGKRVDVDWEKALAFVENLVKTQGEDAGGAAYNERTPQGGTQTNAAGRVALRAYGSMTYAAVLSMCHANLDRGDPRVRQSLEYCRNFWSLDENPGMGNQGLYYFYDILARALSAAKVEKVGDHDWKKELSEKIISLQRPDGSWCNENNRFWEGDPVLCTSFAILALELCR